MLSMLGWRLPPRESLFIKIMIYSILQHGSLTTSYHLLFLLMFLYVLLLWLPLTTSFFSYLPLSCLLLLTSLLAILHVIQRIQPHQNDRMIIGWSFHFHHKPPYCLGPKEILGPPVTLTPSTQQSMRKATNAPRHRRLFRRMFGKRGRAKQTEKEKTGEFSFGSDSFPVGS